MHETELAAEDDRDGEATTRIQPAEVTTTLKDSVEGTTVLQRYEGNAPRASWIRRIVNWFRRD